MTITQADGLDIEVVPVSSKKTVVLRVTGEVDASTGPRLHRALAAATGNYRKVVLDLRGVSFFGAAGLNVLAYSIKLRRGWNTLRIQNPSRPVKRILELSGFDRLIKVVVGPGGTRPLHRIHASTTGVVNLTTDTRRFSTEASCLKREGAGCGSPTRLGQPGSARSPPNEPKLCGARFGG